MAVYYCHSCDRYRDDDWHPMEEGGICPECKVEAEEREGEDYRKPRIPFDRNQRLRMNNDTV